MAVTTIGVALAVAATATTASAISARKQAKTAQQARDAQATELKKQEGIQAKADKLTAERTAKADAAATERKARLSQGRKGLLYEGNETGVTNNADVLGG